MSSARCSSGGYGHDRVVGAAQRRQPARPASPPALSSWVADRLDRTGPAGIAANLLDVCLMVTTVIILAHIFMTSTDPAWLTASRTSSPASGRGVAAAR